MSNNNINTLSRIDQAIRGLNEDGGDDNYIPAQSTNGALERINQSIRELDIKGIKAGLPKVTNADNGKVLQVKAGKWAKGDKKIEVEAASDFIQDFDVYKDKDTLVLVQGTINSDTRLNASIESASAASGIVTLTPSDGYVEGYEGWRAFHDGDEHGWSTAETGPYLTYMFDSAKEIKSITATLKWEGTFEPARLFDIYFSYTTDGINWSEEEEFFGYTVTSLTPVDHTDHTKTFGKPSLIKGIRFHATRIMTFDNCACHLHDVVIKGLAGDDYTSDRSIWYKGIEFGCLYPNGTSESY